MLLYARRLAVWYADAIAVEKLCTPIQVKRVSQLVSHVHLNITEHGLHMIYTEGNLPVFVYR